MKIMPLLFCLVALFCAALWAYDEDYALMYQRYGATNWTPRINYHHAAVNWWVNSLVVVPTGTVSKIYPPRPGSRIVSEVKWHSRTNSVVNMRGAAIVSAGDSFDQSVELMMEAFSNRARLHSTEHASGMYANLGDYAYVDIITNHSKVIDYVRNNVYVRVYGSDFDWVDQTAFSIDTAILNASTNTVLTP